MGYKIVSDSSSNLTELNDLPYCTVPLKIVTDQKEYVDSPDLDVRGMVEDLQSYKGKSGSSCPNAHEWLEAFGEADAIIGITISSNISGSYAAAMQARKDYLAKRPDAKVFIVDSRTAGSEMHLVIEKLRELILQGLSFEEVVKQINAYRRSTHTIFALQSLKNLANNGRVSPAAAAISGALGIRVVGTASDEGTLLPQHKCRGEKAMLKTIVKVMLESGWKGGKVRLSHCFSLPVVSGLVELLRGEHKNCDIEILPCTALCSFYAEKGGLIVGYEGACR